MKTSKHSETTADDRNPEQNDCSLAELVASTNKPIKTVRRWLKNGWLERSGESNDFADTTRVTRASFDALLDSGKLRPARRERNALPARLAQVATITSQSKPAQNPTSEQSRPSPAVDESGPQASKKRKKRKSDYRQAKRMLRRLSLPALLRVGRWLPDRIAHLAPLNQSITGITNTADLAIQKSIQNKTNDFNKSK